MRNYIIYEINDNDNILVKFNSHRDIGRIQKELIDKGYAIIKTTFGTFNNDSIIEAIKLFEV